MTLLYIVGAFSHTFQKIYKSYQANECCRHETVNKIKLLQYDKLRSSVFEMCDGRLQECNVIFDRAQKKSMFIKCIPCVKYVTHNFTK